MREERMKILDMLEKQVITAEEATRLLNTLSGAKSDDDKLADFARNVQDFAKEVGEKTKEVCEKVSPKVKVATKAMVIKTAEVVDNLSKSLSEAVKKMECEIHPDGDCDCDGDGEDE